MHLSVPFIFSTSPLHRGLYGVVNNCFTEISLLISFISSDVNWLPLSLSTSFGNPNRQNTDINASATRSVSIDFKGIASGYLVAKSTIVKMYRLPCSAQALSDQSNPLQSSQMAHS